MKLTSLRTPAAIGAAGAGLVAALTLAVAPTAYADELWGAFATGDNGHWGGAAGAALTEVLPPLWVIVSCALAMAAGTYLGGWRVIRTLGKGLVDIESPQGMSAESSSAAIILLSSHFGYSLSTTQVVTGSVLGAGVGKPDGAVRWGVVRRLAVAWLITLPLAGTVGAVGYQLIHLIGGYGGVAAGLGVLLVIATLIWLQSRKVRIDHTNVTADWGDGLTGGLGGVGEPDLGLPAPELLLGTPASDVAPAQAVSES